MPLFVDFGEPGISRQPHWGAIWSQVPVLVAIAVVCVPARNGWASTPLSRYGFRLCFSSSRFRDVAQVEVQVDDGGDAGHHA